MFECAHCGKEITKLYFHDGKCYGSACIKRFYGAAAVKAAQWISLDDFAALACVAGVTYEVETLRIPRWIGKRAHLSNGKSVSFAPVGATWKAHAETARQALI